MEGNPKEIFINVKQLIIKRCASLPAVLDELKADEFYEAFD